MMSLYKPSIFDLQAELCLAMSNPTRLRIVHLLREGPQRVSDICRILETNQPTISRHLAVLRRAGILQTVRQGADVIYQVGNPKVVEICEMMRELLAERELQRSELISHFEE